MNICVGFEVFGHRNRTKSEHSLQWTVCPVTLCLAASSASPIELMHKRIMSSSFASLNQNQFKSDLSGMRFCGFVIFALYFFAQGHFQLIKMLLKVVLLSLYPRIDWFDFLSSQSRKKFRSMNWLPQQTVWLNRYSPQLAWLVKDWKWKQLCSRNLLLAKCFVDLSFITINEQLCQYSSEGKK